MPWQPYPVADPRKVAVAAATGLDREATLTLVDELWQAPVHERRTAAIEILIRNTRLLTADDLAVVSGVTFREAVRHLPEKDREALLAAYRTR